MKHFTYLCIEMHQQQCMVNNEELHRTTNLYKSGKLDPSKHKKVKLRKYHRAFTGRLRPGRGGETA